MPIHSMVRSTLLCVAAAIVSTAASAAQSYTLTLLESNGGSRSEAYAVNRSGVVAGVSSHLLDDQGNELYAPAWWSGSTPAELPLMGGSAGFAYGINGAGDMVGSVRWGTGLRAVLWRNGQAMDLGTLGLSSKALAINSSGGIVGESSSNGQTVYAVRWRAGQMKQLKSLGGSYSSAAALNNAGTIVGTSSTPDGAAFAVRWQDGAITQLGNLEEGGVGAANGINADGVIVGWSTAQGFAHAARWVNDVPEDLGTLQGGVSMATAVNDHGRVVGASDDGQGGALAVMWVGKRVIDLNTLVDQATRDAGWVLFFANAINNHGDIAGTAYNAGSNTLRGFLLTRQ